MSVELIEYNNNEISKLRIIDNKGKVRYHYGCFESTPERKTPKNNLKVDESKQNVIKKLATPQQIAEISSFGEVAINWCLNTYKIKKMEDLSFEDAEKIIIKIGLKKGNKNNE